LQNAEDLLRIVERHANVAGIVSGHNHCAAEEQRGASRFMVTPSTAAQLSHDPAAERPDSAVHRVDRSRCGFRRLLLHPDGMIETEVIWSRVDRREADREG
jgi:Icc protein